MILADVFILPYVVLCDGKLYCHFFGKRIRIAYSGAKHSISVKLIVEVITKFQCYTFVR